MRGKKALQTAGKGPPRHRKGAAPPSSSPVGQRVWDGQRQAAGAMGIDLALIRAAKQAGCPAFRGPRVYEAELLPWLEEHRGELLNPKQTGADWGREVRMEEALWRRLRREKAIGALVSRQWVAERIMRMAGEISTLQSRSEAEHPIRLAAAGSDVASNRQVLRGIWDEIRAAVETLGRHLREDSGE